MFTGIIEQMGTVRTVDENGSASRVRLHSVGLADVEPGASLSINGVCLTVVEVSGDEVAVDVIPETLARSNLGGLAPGDPVNLERAMPASGRFDGHIVQGHVDGIGEVQSVDSTEDGTVFRVSAPRTLLRQIAEKGSVAIDGVSLTVTRVEDESFEVALIPHTLEHTTLGLRKTGDTVNLETDVIAKYLDRLVRGHT